MLTFDITTAHTAGQLSTAIVRGMRAAATLARDPRLPRWLRVMLVIGVLPIPGPVDNVVLFVAVGILALRHRPILADAWRNAGPAVAS